MSIYDPIEITIEVGGRTLTVTPFGDCCPDCIEEGRDVAWTVDELQRCVEVTRQTLEKLPATQTGIMMMACHECLGKNLAQGEDIVWNMHDDLNAIADYFINGGPRPACMNDFTGG